MSASRVTAVAVVPVDRQAAPVYTAAEWWGPRLSVLVALLWIAAIFLGHVAVLGVLAFLGFALALVGLRYPALGLFGAALLCVLDAPARVFVYNTSRWLHWNTFNYWLLIVILLRVPYLVRLRDLPSKALVLLLLVLGAGMTVTPVPANGLQHMLAAVTTFGLMAYFAAAQSDETAWYWMGVLSGVAGAFGSLSFYLSRAQLPYIDPNTSSFLPLTSLFGICLAFPMARRRPWGPLLLLVAASIDTTWVFLSGSRGGMLMALCCICYLVWSLGTLRRRLAFLLTAAIVALAVSTQFTNLQERAFHRVDKLLNPSYSLVGRTSGRSDLVLGGLYIFLDHPLGVGTGGFSNAWQNLGHRKGLSGFKANAEFQAHAGWIKVLAENGVPGVLLLVAYVCSFAWVGCHTTHRERWRLGLLVTGVLSLAFCVTEFQSKGIWFLAAAAAVLLNPALPVSSRSRAESFGRTPRSRIP